MKGLDKMFFKKWFLMESHGPAFLTAILGNPTDETNYLVYADWLDENNSSPIAQFIRMTISRRKHPKGQLGQLNAIIRQALPEVRRLVRPYLWTYVNRNENRISMAGANQDANREYMFYFHDHTFRFTRSTWGDTRAAFGGNPWITAKAPGGVLIAEPRQGSVAGGDRDGMGQLRQEAAKWDVPYIGNIVRNPPDNLLHAMVLGNLYWGIPPHVRRQGKRSQREDYY